MGLLQVRAYWLVDLHAERAVLEQLHEGPALHFVQGIQCSLGGEPVHHSFPSIQSTAARAWTSVVSSSGTGLMAGSAIRVNSVQPSTAPPAPALASLPTTL